MSVVSLSLKFARAQCHARARMREIVKTWQAVTCRVLHRYQPEFHYMRGPGPKWREKHGDSVRQRR